MLHRMIYPYCLRTIEPLSKRWLLLNRDYQPLGFVKQNLFLRYEEYPISFQFRRALVAAQIKKIAWDGKFRDGHIWLFADHNAPWRGEKFLIKYAKRLDYLLGLRLKMED